MCIKEQRNLFFEDPDINKKGLLQAIITLLTKFITI